MSFAHALVQDINSSVEVVDAPEGLSVFREPGCAAAIWRRQPLPSFQAWIDGLTPGLLPDGRVIARPKDVRATMEQLCDLSGMPDCDERQILVDDTAALAGIFAAVMETRCLQLRLDVVDSNACRKFHIDAITARLICTYRGTGTQYGVSADGGDPTRVFTVPTGSPILLRGTLWPSSREKSRLLHRSPPIEGTGETRLLLVLDVASDWDV